MQVDQGAPSVSAASDKHPGRGQISQAPCLQSVARRRFPVLLPIQDRPHDTWSPTVGSCWPRSCLVARARRPSLSPIRYAGRRAPGGSRCLVAWFSPAGPPRALVAGRLLCSPGLRGSKERAG